PGLPAGRVVDENVSLVDVAPTLLDLLHLRSEPRFEGRSLLPAMQGYGEARDVLAELWPSNDNVNVRRHTLAFIRGGTKMLVGSDGVAAETFDLPRDPAESRPVATHDAVAGLRRALEDKEVDLRRRASAATAR